MNTLRLAPLLSFLPLLAAAGLSATSPKNAPGVDRRYGRLPLHFEPNRGQVNGPALFTARGGGMRIFLTERETLLVLQRPKLGVPAVAARGEPAKVEQAVVRMSSSEAGGPPP